MNSRPQITVKMMDKYMQN